MGSIETKFVEGALHFGKGKQNKLPKAKEVLGSAVTLSGESVIEFAGPLLLKRIEIIKDYIKMLNNSSYLSINGKSVNERTTRTTRRFNTDITFSEFLNESAKSKLSIGDWVKVTNSNINVGMRITELETAEDYYGNPLIRVYGAQYDTCEDYVDDFNGLLYSDDSSVGTTSFLVNEVKLTSPKGVKVGFCDDEFNKPTSKKAKMWEVTGIDEFDQESENINLDVMWD